MTVALTPKCCARRCGAGPDPRPRRQQCPARPAGGGCWRWVRDLRGEGSDGVPGCPQRAARQHAHSRLGTHLSQPCAAAEVLLPATLGGKCMGAGGSRHKVPTDGDSHNIGAPAELLVADLFDHRWDGLRVRVSSDLRLAMPDRNFLCQANLHHDLWPSVLSLLLHRFISERHRVWQCGPA